MEIFWFMVFSLAGGAASLVVFIYYLKKGQFDEPEDPKYQLFRDEEDNA